jgi:hypothetical protein
MILRVVFHKSLNTITFQEIIRRKPVNEHLSHLQHENTKNLISGINCYYFA